MATGLFVYLFIHMLRTCADFYKEQFLKDTNNKILKFKKIRIQIDCYIEFFDIIVNKWPKYIFLKYTNPL